MIAVSTSWCSGRLPDAASLIDRLRQIGVARIELEYRVTTALYHDLAAALPGAGIRVVSVHNYFPFPADLPPAFRPDGDLFSLCHLDAEHRQRAVELTVRTVERANGLEAGAVVLHGGRVEMTSEFERIRRWFESGQLDGEESKALIREKRVELEQRKPAHLDALRFSLDRLVRAAERHGVQLGLENRYHYHGMPGVEDIPRLLDEFRGASLGYWHDTGHAHAAAVLGFAPADGLLKTVGNRLVGAHIHDARGLDDHLPPGTGEIDFDPLRDCLGPDTPVVVELKPRTPDAAVRESIDWLRERTDRWGTGAAKENSRPSTGDSTP